MGGAILLADAGQAVDNLSIFQPASPPAAAIRDLAFVVLAITGVIFLIVEVVLVYSIIRFRKRPTTDSNEPPQVYGSHPIEIAWTAAPALIVLVLVLVVARTEWDVRPKPPIPKVGENKNELFVTVVGCQWWWEYRYEFYDGEKLNFITANELHVPASDPATPRKIYLTLVSKDVCHSFWVPRLAGKTDLIPARTNDMYFQTTERGLFLGQCAEFCGNQHAKMLLRVYVDEPADFDAWLANQKKDAEPPKDDVAKKGQELFLQEKGAFDKQSCISCHRIRGTVAKGTYGPDLTHLMSRQTLASGIMPNTKENLKAWVSDPQKDKPRCLMPAFNLSAADLDMVVEYLRTLK